MHRPSNELTHEPTEEQRDPVGLSRRAKHVLIVLFFAIQFALPLHYYVGSDPYDERFAWRMYSPMRMVKCQAGVFEIQGRSRTKIKLSRDVGMPWVKGIARGNLRVLEAYARRRCSALKAEGRPAHLYASVRCTLPDGSLDTRSVPSENLCAP